MSDYLIDLAALSRELNTSPERLRALAGTTVFLPWSWTTQNGWCIRRQDLNRWRRAVEEGRHAPP
jgi:hypothetical protein